MEGKKTFGHVNMEKGLEMFDNDRDVYMEIVKLFCKNASKQIESIVRSIEKEDYAAYGREIHTLKSLAGNLGAEELLRLAVKHDTAYKRKDYLFLKNSYWEIVSLYSEVVQELNGFYADRDE
ncbi:MAG TPA: Hpt domain-containing protein [Lachnospiraceae bacterium]|nr:Hpt domain-containing protein [Lachnospiraceae bacterium]